MNGAILCVTRNNLHLTKKAINSAANQDIPCTVMTMDNQSQDGTLLWLKTKTHPFVHFTTQQALATCWNRGLRALFNMAERVLVINNDIELRPDTFRLLAEFSTSGHPFVSCVSVGSPDQLGTPGDRCFTDLLKSMRPHPDFSCFMIHRSVFDIVGKFDETYYPAYCEDNDYHVRMHRAGIKAVCVDLPFLHHGAQTVKTASEGEQARIRRGADINRERFRKQYGCLPGTQEYEALFQ